MNENGFLMFLQQLLTMVEKTEPASVQCAKNALENVYALARQSGKSDSLTIRMMDSAIRLFDRLVWHKEDFAGQPGDYAGNEAKRHHLRMMLWPGC